MSQIEKKQGKPTCKSILSKNPNMKKKNKIKPKLRSNMFFSA